MGGFRVASIISAALALLASAASAAPANVWADKGRLYYHSPDGQLKQLTKGDDRAPVLSPDGRSVAYIHAGPGGDWVWTLNLATGAAASAVQPFASATPGPDFTSLKSLTWSPDGKTLYVMAQAWADQDSIHAVNLGAHSQRYIAKGLGRLKILRDGPYKGDLLVTQNLTVKGGADHTPVVLLKPDGSRVMIIPGTDGNAEEGARAWLDRGGWTAN